MYGLSTFGWTAMAMMDWMPKTLCEPGRDRTVRFRVKLHGIPCSPRGLEHIGDLRIHGLIDPQGEGTGPVRPGPFHGAAP